MKKYNIGYTTGVFDLFHIAHLNILRRAKEQCEYLIVGVSTDECVKTYKNKTPIIPFEQRMQIVEAIKYVDKVVPQTSMNKIEVWKELKFEEIEPYMLSNGMINRRQNLANIIAVCAFIYVPNSVRKLLYKFILRN